jgi:hypothetical protein
MSIFETTNTMQFKHFRKMAINSNEASSFFVLVLEFELMAFFFFLPELALNHDSPIFTSQVAGIITVSHELDSLTPIAVCRYDF